MLIIDNYDSFTYNLVQYFKILGQNPIVVKNDEHLPDVDFQRIVISPGAGNPDNSGLSMAVLKKYYSEKPILGVCLGHQCIAKFFGAEIIKAKEPMHGKVSKVFYKDGEPLFAGLPQGFNATRYHSLVVSNLPESLEVIAQTDNVIMALKHRKLPIYGVQFHPEAILTEGGLELLGNFIHATM
ncbi:MAG: aminodeoxychorismate/anthranilate synthase component II [Fusobacterium sp.]|nr:aminodeoxychorismate/anthranilate synthase component II [Fusobacterium sp.]